MFAAGIIRVWGIAIGAPAPVRGGFSPCRAARRARIDSAPPVTVVALQAALTAFTDAIAAQDILNGNSGQLLPRVTPVKNAKAYEVRYALDTAGQPQGPWQSGGLFTNSRSMPINGLTPGQNYMFQVRAIGGSTGYSDWSNPVGHMSM